MTALLAKLVRIQESKTETKEARETEEVEIDDFGGEGTGLKSMRDLEWSEGEVVTFMVSGTEDKNKKDWVCTCHFIHQGLNKR